MVNGKLDLLRSEMKKRNIAALIIPSTDPHQSEYIADYWKCREWISGFTGSSGVVVVTQSHAGLWTDSRYFIQAEKELAPSFELHKQVTKGPEYLEWIFKTLSYGEIVGYQAELFSVATIEHFKNRLQVKQIKILAIPDIFELIWTDRPALTIQKVQEHDIEFACISRDEKINILKDKIKQIGATNILLTKLDDIAWLLNIRGNDVPYNPVVTSYFLITPQHQTLFIDIDKLPLPLINALEQSKIKLEHYTEIRSALKQIKEYSRIIVDKSATNDLIYSCIAKSCEIINDTNTVSRLKAIKSAKEIQHIKNAHLRDGLALCNFYNWLDDNYKDQTITELGLVEKIGQFRYVQDNFVGLSFATIVAFGANAALPHYAPNTISNANINDSTLLLIDSGGQYLDGTTDITRTICLGKPTSSQKRDFTLVLKGHINLATAKFPKGTKGYQLDMLAREFLWKDGKNYGHGTGHGVGYFLNVHEGPQGFSPDASGPANTIIEPGMVITNEPGYYLENQYGIRIENMLVCIAESDEYLSFETISYCPIDKNLIDKKILTGLEISWLNDYHKQAYEKLSPNACAETKDWLRKKTKPL